MRHVLLNCKSLNANFSSNNFATKSKRKTLTAGDVFNALGDIEFEQLVPDLKQFLEGKYYILCVTISHSMISIQGRTER